MNAAHTRRSEGSDLSLGVIVVNHNGGEDLRRCVDSVLVQLGAEDRVVVVDNASTDGSLGLLDGLDDRVHVLRRANDGFGGGANAGAAHAATDLLLFLNPDVELGAGCLRSLRTSLAATSGIVGPVVVEGADAKVCYGATLDFFGSPGALTDNARHPLYVPGCAIGIPRPLFERIGGFDARYFLFMEDTELCWRAWIFGAGVSVDSGARCTHRGGGSIEGGYPVTGGWSTSEQRIALRERNTMATYLSCLPATVVGPALCVAAARLATLTVAFTLLGRPSAAWELLRGFGWFSRELPRTLHRRTSLPAARRARWRPLRHLARRCFYLDVVRSFGLPHINFRKPA